MYVPVLEGSKVSCIIDSVEEESKEEGFFYGVAFGEGEVNEGGEDDVTDDGEERPDDHG